MKPKIIPLLIAIITLGVSCSLPGTGSSGTAEIDESAANTTQLPNEEQSSGQESGLSRYTLPDLTSAFPPPPIVPIPKNSYQISGDSFDGYQVPGDRIRLLCKQPCGLDVRMMYALYGIYKVTVQAVVRTAGFDILDKMGVLDIHLDRDNVCTRYEGELGLTTSYPDNPDSIVICLYLLDTQMETAPQTFIPENAIRSNGVGVFAHEYAHALFFGRFTPSHDFVYPIEYMTADPGYSTYYMNLCESIYQNNAPLSYQLCQNNGFTFDDMIQSLLDINRLYDDGYGNLQGGMVGYLQYQAILENILGSETEQALINAGYQKIFIEEGNIPYTLPYAGESCTYRAQLVGDGSIPPGTVMDVNTSFEKVWRIKNTGTCKWENAQLVFVRGEAMVSTTTVSVPDTATGTEAEVTVPMTAPAEAGVHVGEWRLRTASGQDFGPIINLTLYVRPGCSLPPVLSFFTAKPATIGPGALSLLSWGQVTNVDSVEIIGLGSIDPNGGRLLVQPDQTTTYSLKATCSGQATTSQITVMVDSNLPTFAIDSINAAADPSHFSGSCGGGIVVNFYGTFSSNGPGVVVYQWIWSDGSASDPDISIIDQAGEQSIPNSWTISGSYESFVDFKILAPIEKEAVRANFSLTCLP